MPITEKRRSSSIRDTDDYLTARFANPFTGVISPSVYSLAGSGRSTPRTPQTPGEALAIFYGDGVGSPNGKERKTEKAELGAGGGLNEYFGLGLESGKKVKRPLLRRAVGEQAERQAKDAATLRNERSISAGSENATPARTANPERFPPTECDINRVASYWSKARRRLQGSEVSVSDTEQASAGQRDLSHLPQVKLIHPSQAALPKDERVSCHVYELTGSTAFRVKRKPHGGSGPGIVLDKTVVRRWWSTDTLRGLFTTVEHPGTATPPRVAKLQSTKPHTTRSYSETATVKKPLHIPHGLARQLGTLRRAFYVGFLTLYGLILAWQSIGLAFDCLSMGLRFLRLVMRVVSWFFG